MCSGFEVGRMRKKNPRVDLRHRSCATFRKNTPNIVWPKQCVPKERAHDPDRKISQILWIFLQNDMMHSIYENQEINEILQAVSS